jgi:hypothetical protein
MRYLFTPSSLFRAWTLGAEGDPDIADGVHVRVWFDPRLGLPLAPFLGLQVTDKSYAALVGMWRDKDGTPLILPIDLQQQSFVEVHIPSTNVGGYLSWPCRVRVQTDPGAEIEASLLDRNSPGRVLATWITDTPVITGSQVVRIRLRGRGQITGLSGIDLGQLVAATAGATETAIIFGLPFDGDEAWYTKGQGEGAALQRVAEGAPRRLGPPDRPDGSSPAATADDEVERLRVFGAEVLGWVKTAISDPSIPTPLVRLGFDDTANPAPQFPKKSAVDMNAVDVLMTTAVDPGIARLLGFATRLADHVPPPDRPLAWIIAGAFVLNPRPSFPHTALLDDLLGPPNPAEQAIAGALSTLFPRLTDLQAGLPPGWTMRCLFAGVASGVAAKLPPPAKVTISESGTWNVGRPSKSWAQAITLSGDPPLGPIALARDASGTLISLHEKRPTNGTFAERRAAMLTSRNGAGKPTLADLDVPDDTARARWQVWQADTFGRWSEPSSVEGEQPSRPAPQPPTIETDLRLAGADIPGDEPRSPGNIGVVVPIPPLSSLVPGARPLTSLKLTIDGVAEDIGVAQPALFSADARIARSVAVAPTSVGGQVSVSVEAAFFDDVGNKSTETKTTVVVRDPRRPPAMVCEPTLIWTSRRDSVGNAEIALAWMPLPGHAAYRVYLSDENRLASSLQVALPVGATRADIAKFLSDRGASAAGKEAFSLATKTAVAVPATGPVHFRAQLPGSLAGVIFARVVPLTDGNVEARFADCGLVCVAVPHDQKPPAPTLRVTPRPDGCFDFAIQAIGFRPDLLKALQPNLLGGVAGTPGAAAPEFRLRRTQGAATQALYAREVKRKTMMIEAGGDGSHWWVANTDGPAAGFPPFVNFTWFAQVRYPAEIGRQVGAVDVPSNITPDDGAVAGDLESSWSEASLPQTAMLVPLQPNAPVGATVIRSPAGAQIDIPNPPIASPAAVAPYRIRIWRRDVDKPFELLSPTDAPTTAPFNVIDPVVAAEYAIAYVDPIGRVGPVAIIGVP